MTNRKPSGANLAGAADFDFHDFEVTPAPPLVVYSITRPSVYDPTWWLEAQARLDTMWDAYGGWYQSGAAQRSTQDRNGNTKYD